MKRNAVAFSLLTLSLAIVSAPAHSSQPDMQTSNASALRLRLEEEHAGYSEGAAAFTVSATNTSADRIKVFPPDLFIILRDAGGRIIHRNSQQIRITTMLVMVEYAPNQTRIFKTNLTRMGFTLARGSYSAQVDMTGATRGTRSNAVVFVI